MYVCEICNKKFKSAQGLGGHMQVHRQGSAENSNGELEQVEGQSPPPETDGSGVRDGIRSLLRDGYSPKIIKEQFGYNRATVDEVSKEFIQPDQPQEANQRNGAGLVRQQKESVLPEWLEGEVAEVFDGDKPTQKIFMAGMAVPLLGLRLFGEAINPLTKLMSTWQEGQAKVFEAMQGSSADAAQRAAAMAGGDVMAHIDQKFAETQGKKKDIAETPDPMKGLMARTMETLMNQITGQLTGGQGGGQGGQTGTGIPPGWEDKTKAGGN